MVADTVIKTIENDTLAGKVVTSPSKVEPKHTNFLEQNLNFNLVLCRQ